MLRGVDYLHSDSKRAFDVAVSTALLPVAAAARLGATATFGYEVHHDERVGQHGTVVTIPKIRTLTEDGDVINGWAELYREKALDELLQLALIKDGVMSVIGRRHLLPEDYDHMRSEAKKSVRGTDLLAQYDDIVMPAKCGLASSFAMHAHTRGTPSVLQRLAYDLHDHQHASIAYDMRLLTRGLRSAALNELKNGSHPISQDRP